LRASSTFARSQKRCTSLKETGLGALGRRRWAVAGDGFEASRSPLDASQIWGSAGAMAVSARRLFKNGACRRDLGKLQKINSLSCLAAGELKKSG
jgi:hypothetical protein